MRAKWTWAHLSPTGINFGPVLAPYGTPQNYAYTQAKWTWAPSGLRKAPCGTPPKYAYYTSEVDLGPFRAPVGPTSACSGPLWDPAKLYMYTSEVDLGPVWAQSGPSALCINTSEMDLGPFRAPGVGKSLSQEVGRSSGAARSASKSVDH